MTNKTNHGGKRAGSGVKKGQVLVPPHLKKVGVYIKLPQWLADWLGEHKGQRPVLIEEALCKVHKLKPPTPPGK